MIDAQAPRRKTPPPRVLLIESDPAVAQAIMRGLSRAGLPVNRASTGVDGLAIAARLKPDVVLLALTLPDIGSASLIARLRQQQMGVIAISGLGDAGRYLADSVIGVDAYIAKPPVMRDIVACVYAVAEAAAAISELPA